MIRILAFIALAIAPMSPASAAERRFPVTDFERVVVEGPYRVQLAVGGSSSAVATGSPQALDAISVEVQGRTLRVRRNGNNWGGNPARPAEPATITLTTRTLRAARLLGAGSLLVTGAKGLRIDLAVEGNGRLTAAAIDADNLSVGVRGSGSLELQGTAETFSANIQGSGSLNGAGFSAETATIFSATFGEIRLAVRRAVTVSANGIGLVVIDGEPACTVRGPAASDVRCGRAR